MRRTPTKRKRLRLTGRAPGWLMAAGLVLTGSAWGWLVGLNVRNSSHSSSTLTVYYFSGGVAVLWMVLVYLLGRWRTADRATFSQVTARSSDLAKRVNAQNAELEERKTAEQKTAELLAEREQAISDLEREVQELRRSTERAVTAERDARTSDRAKSEYLARLSGEIRMPLTNILGFVTTLLTTGDLSKAPPERVEALVTIKQNGEKLLDKIDDTIELCHIELQECQVERRNCSLFEIVDEVYRLMSVWAEARGLTLIVDYQGQMPASINTDPDRLTQILVNLLGNAIKFTLSGDVRMRINLVWDDPQDPQLCFDVVDSGVGMHEDQADYLFSGFGSAATDANGSPQSSGLGLTISKRYAEILGGDIVLLDTRTGIGTRMRLAIRIGSLEDVEMVEPPIPSREPASPAEESCGAVGSDGALSGVQESDSSDCVHHHTS